MRSFSFATTDVESSSSGRTDMWRQSWQSSTSTPGSASARAGYTDVNPPMIYPHNLLLEVGVELGIAGSFSSWRSSATPRSAWAAYRRGPPADRVTVATVLALFRAALVNAMFSYALHSNWEIWMWAGVGMAPAARRPHAPARPARMRIAYVGRWSDDPATASAARSRPTPTSGAAAATTCGSSGCRRSATGATASRMGAVARSVAGDGSRRRAVERYAPDVVYVRYGLFLPSLRPLQRRFATVVELNATTAPRPRPSGTGAARAQRGRPPVAARRRGGHRVRRARDRAGRRALRRADPRDRQRHPPRRGRRRRPGRTRARSRRFLGGRADAVARARQAPRSRRALPGVGLRLDRRRCRHRCPRRRRRTSPAPGDGARGLRADPGARRRRASARWRCIAPGWTRPAR